MVRRKPWDWQACGTARCSLAAEPSKLQVCVSSPSQLESKTCLGRPSDSYNLHVLIDWLMWWLIVCNGLGACRPSVDTYRLTTDISLCHHLWLPVHIYSNRHHSTLLSAFRSGTFVQYTSLSALHYWRREGQFAERHEATKMCKFNKSVGKSLAPFLPCWFTPTCDMDADRVSPRQAFRCPAHVLSDIQHNMCSKMTRVHL